MHNTCEPVCIYSYGINMQNDTQWRNGASKHLFFIIRYWRRFMGTKRAQSYHSAGPCGAAVCVSLFPNVLARTFFFFLQLLWRSVSLRVLTHAIYDHSSYLPAKWLVMVDVMNSRSVAFEQHLARLVSFAKWSQTSYFFFGCAVKCWIEFIYVTAMNTGY